jgi:hypothetical protein
MVSPIECGGIYMVDGNLTTGNGLPGAASATGRTQHVNDTTDRHYHHKAN